MFNYKYPYNQRARNYSHTIIRTCFRPSAVIPLLLLATEPGYAPLFLACNTEVPGPLHPNDPAGFLRAQSGQFIHLRKTVRNIFRFKAIAGDSFDIEQEQQQFEHVAAPSCIPRTMMFRLGCDRQTDRQTDGQTDRQITHADKQMFRTAQRRKHADALAITNIRILNMHVQTYASVSGMQAHHTFVRTYINYIHTYIHTDTYMHKFMHTHTRKTM